MAGYGLHIIQFPSKKFGFVGSIPISLGEEVPASPADVMGCRSHWNLETGRVCTWKFPSFDTLAEAEAHVKEVLGI